jgi:histidyl-tRNA synthetase
MASKPSIPKGTRDFGPSEMAKRNYIFSTIKSVFEAHGFLPIETPAMELSKTLLGKYGEEGDKLLFRIMPRGEKIKRIHNSILDSTGVDRHGFNPKIIESFAEEALRYDLTVPFARFVVQHRNELNFPFKRYQIQPVWRADRPQRGRYREFYQCDVDVVGSDSLLNEIELIQIVSKVYSSFGLRDVQLKLNNRKILQGIAEVIGSPDKIIDLTIALDKLDKLPQEKVLEELTEKGFSSEAINQVEPLLNLPEGNEARLDTLRTFLANSNIGLKGLDELTVVLNGAKSLEIDDMVSFEVTLARGLNYYTGAIFEVVHPDFPSSITGGGRYDDLTGIFGLKDVSGVGISFGADRIYDLLEAKNLYPEQALQPVDVLFINFGDAEAMQCVKLADELRVIGLAAEVYPDAAKMKKQMKYANDRGFKYVVMLGSRELENGTLSLKNMLTGEQEELQQTQLSARIHG